MAYGRGGEQYYVHQDNANYVEGWDEYVDEDYHDYHDVVWCEARSEYWRAEDCWQCQATNDWYPEKYYDYVEVDGETYLPGNEPETTEAAASA